MRRPGESGRTSVWSGPALEDRHEEVRSVGIRAAVRRVLSARSVAAGAPGGPEGWAGRMRQALRQLDERFPELSHWMGGRLDIEVPAILVSMGVHGVLLLVLATAGYAV